MKAIISSQAKRDLKGIILFIAKSKFDPKSAIRIGDQIIETCDHIAELSLTTRMVQSAPDIGVDVRLYHFKRWVIVYRYVSHGVEVLRICNQSQDYMNWKL
ncbi:type II toxin-antitoxin system RelE/ParE family toxin [Lacunimicrobium album]